MIKLFLDFIQFLFTVAPLLTSLAVFTLLAVLLSKSIKRYATIYYVAFAVPFLLVAVPFIGRLLEFEMYPFGKVPFLGSILRDYIHMGTLGFPLLIIIMYAGALNPKKPMDRKLLSIRKELSILSGFPVLTHSLVRVANNFPNALRFFTDNEGYMATAKVSNEWGAAMTNFSFVLGILLLALFIPLWITSFQSVHTRMGNKSWKKLQKWAYVFYALLFIHSLGIQCGYLLNPRERDLPKKPAIEAAAAAPGKQVGRSEAARPSENRRAQSIGFSDIKVDRQTKQYIHIVSLIFIFGSYLYLRIRKSSKDAARKRIRRVQTCESHVLTT